MKATIVAVVPAAGKTVLHVEVNHGKVPDFIYDPPTDDVANDPRAFRKYQREIQAARKEHVQKHKTKARPTKALIGKVVDLSL